MRLTLTRLRGAASKLLDQYGNYHPSVLTIQQFIDFAKKNPTPTASFLFLRKEIPVRLANIMKEIKLLPEPLHQTASFRQVQGWYEQSFEDILEFENADPSSKKIIDRFSHALDKIQNRHLTVVETMANGVNEMKAKLNNHHSHQLDDRMQYFLDRFYLSRIGIRLLIHQHLLLFTEVDHSSRHVGCFDPVCNIKMVALDAYDNARFLCEQYYNRAPSCKFICISRIKGLIKKQPGKEAIENLMALTWTLVTYDQENDGKDIVMTYVPYHLYYMLFELLKNALRAVVEFHNDMETLPPVKLLVCKGREDVTIKISDQGGGVPRTEVDKLMKYMYSTAPKPPSPSAITTTPIAGYGYGLPISRLYAKYLNGDLWLNSVDGFGTDAMIYLKVFPKDASELLPVYNKTSSQKYKAAEQVGDWSEPNHHGMDYNHRM